MKITIFWLAWTGTSTIWKMLSKKLWYDFMSTWNIMRSWADELGITLYEFEDKVAKADYSFDIKLDNKVKDYWLHNDNFVFESRLAWNFIADSFKIYLYCDDEERYRRISSRELWDLENIKSKTKKREDELVERYSQVYPDIAFPPKKEDFDLYIDTSDVLPEEILDKILGKINIFQ